MTTLIKSLVGYYDRMANHSNPNRRMPLKGYTRQKLYGEIVLNANGDVIEINELGALETGSKLTGKLLLVPTFMEGRSGNVRPNFLWDNTKYVLNVMWDDNKKNILTSCSKKGDKRFDEFKKFHIDMLQNSDDVEIQALLKFFDVWKSEDYLQKGFPASLVDFNVAFRLEGKRSYLHENAEALGIWNKHFNSSNNSKTGRCLVTGDTGVSISLTHPKIKGAGGKKPETSLVSFNSPAFCSYGKIQNMNAPVSEDVAFRYTTALNSLLAQNSTNKIRIGEDLTVVFWAESANEADADNSENLLASVFSGGKADDDTENQELRIALRNVAEGRMKKNLRPDVETDTVINILGLSPNSARLQIRFWFRDSFGVIAENLEKHYQDLDFTPPIRNGWKHPPSIWALVREACRDGEKNPNYPLMASGILQSILGGTQFPAKFISAVLRRIRVDKISDTYKESYKIARKAALCKAFAVRNFNHSINKETDLMSLNKDAEYKPYLLGRLFAVYEHAENVHKQRGATIRDKMFATAMTSPSKVFSMLARKYSHDLGWLRKSKPGYAVQLEKIISEIKGKMDFSNDPTYPDYLSEDDQGIFDIGYYHQQQEFFTKKDDSVDSSDNQSTINQGDQNND